jgi:hypothetical protein
VRFRNLDDFYATRIDALYTCADPLCIPPQPAVTRAAFVDYGPLLIGQRISENVHGYRLVRFALPQPMQIEGVQFATTTAGTLVHGVSLVDTRTGEFEHLSPLPFRRVLSSDIELYINEDAFGRAFLVPEVRCYDDDFTALHAMRDLDFDPAQVAVVTPPDVPGAPRTTCEPQTWNTRQAAAVVLRYDNHQVSVRAIAPDGGLLVLADGWMTGWQARIGDSAVPIERVNLNQRGVRVPPGEHVVTFTYRPWWAPGLFLFAVLLWLVTLASVVWLAVHLTRTRHRRGRSQRRL